MKNFEELVNYAKNYGFVFQGSEIYGGLANTWDYGPLGVELKNNLKKCWWEQFVTKSIYNVGLDSSILMNSKVWAASGHLDGFSDPLIDCKSCNSRYRADQLIEEQTSFNSDGMSNEKLVEIIKNEKIKCLKCGASDFTDIRNFNLMFETQQGVVEGNTNVIYLRPETAQGIFTNFRNVQRSMRLKLPFGVGQIGKSFRNEITPGNFIFRTREFEQMELEFFCKPGEEEKWFDYWSLEAEKFLKLVGIDLNKIHFRKHSQEELSHYSNATTDIEFEFPFGQKELWGIASRTDFDLKAHMSESKESLEYFDEVIGEKYIPYVIEPSLGVERLFLAVLSSCYNIEDERLIMKFPTKIAPYKAAVLPLVKKYHLEKSEEVYHELLNAFSTTFDMSGSIGKRYARQDAIGTPYCITIDDNTVNEGIVTLRNRDTKEQLNLTIKEAIQYIQKEL